MKKPFAVDLFCGLGGWTNGLLAEGWSVLGVDIERHEYGDHKYPARMVQKDVLELHGRHLRNAQLIVASPPCQEYSYMAMPWSRAKQIARALRGEDDFPRGYKGSRTVSQLTTLFDACFRIQREASEAAGRHIPMVVENVRGAQPWVGRARANYGSFYLWGDVPALMPIPHKARKVPGFRFDGSGKSFQTASVILNEACRECGHHERLHVDDGCCHSECACLLAYPDAWAKFEAQKTIAHVNRRDGYTHTRHLTNQSEHDAVKGFKDFYDSPMCRLGSKSSARKAASARIAMIPIKLSRHIAKFYYPKGD